MSIIEKIGKAFVRHSNVIFAGLSLVSLGWAVYETYKASPEISKAIEEAQAKKSEPLTIPEIAKAAVNAPHAKEIVIACGVAAGSIVAGAVFSEKAINAGGVVVGALAAKNKNLYSTQDENKRREYVQNLIANSVIPECPDDHYILYFDDFSEQLFWAKEGIAIRAEARMNEKLAMADFATYDDCCTLFDENCPKPFAEFGWDKYSFYNCLASDDYDVDDVGLHIFEEPLPAPEWSGLNRVVRWLSYNVQPSPMQFNERDNGFDVR